MKRYLNRKVKGVKGSMTSSDHILLIGLSFDKVNQFLGADQVCHKRPASQVGVCLFRRPYSLQAFEKIVNIVVKLAKFSFISENETALSFLFSLSPHKIELVSCNNTSRALYGLN